MLKAEGEYYDLEIQSIQADLVPPFRQAVENKMVSWRLRFSVAEIAAQMCEHLARAVGGGTQIIDNDIVALYEILISDKEPEVKSEAVAKLHELSRYATP